VGKITPLPPPVPQEQWAVLGNGKAFIEVEATKAHIYTTTTTTTTTDDDDFPDLSFLLLVRSFP
jgi:hypothetical protein